MSLHELFDKLDLWHLSKTLALLKACHVTHILLSALFFGHMRIAGSLNMSEMRPQPPPRDPQSSVDTFNPLHPKSSSTPCIQRTAQHIRSFPTLSSVWFWPTAHANSDRKVVFLAGSNMPRSACSGRCTILSIHRLGVLGRTAECGFGSQYEDVPRKSRCRAKM